MFLLLEPSGNSILHCEKLQLDDATPLKLKEIGSAHLPPNRRRRIATMLQTTGRRDISRIEMLLTGYSNTELSEERQGKAFAMIH